MEAKAGRTLRRTCSLGRGKIDENDPQNDDKIKMKREDDDEDAENADNDDDLGDDDNNDDVDVDDSRNSRNRTIRNSRPAKDSVLFRSDPYLNSLEMEFLILAEESCYATSLLSYSSSSSVRNTNNDSTGIDFEFIYQHATTDRLKHELRNKLQLHHHHHPPQQPPPPPNWSEQQKINALLPRIASDRLIRQRFDTVRQKFRQAMDQGYRRTKMRPIIAQMRIEHRKRVNPNIDKNTT